MNGGWILGIERLNRIGADAADRGIELRSQTIDSRREEASLTRQPDAKCT
jgi:hypothetical protein